MDGKKVLCLHGFGTSAEFMKFQMSSWIERYPKTSFIFMDGFTAFPSSFIQDPDITKFHEKTGTVFGNFGPMDTDQRFCQSLVRPYLLDGRLKEIARVVELIKANGGVEGIVAFSQGAVLAQALCYQVESGLLAEDLPESFRPCFLLLICPPSGFSFPIMLRIPMFLITASNDQVVRDSFLTLIRFWHAQFTEFEGGHKVPVLTSRLHRLVSEFTSKAVASRRAYIAGSQRQKL